MQYNLRFLTILILLFYFSSKIDYLQNDEYAHFSQVQAFMSGNFNLKSYMLPTFYVQGLVGALFAYFFGIEHLAVLTLIFSLGCFVIFQLILVKIINLSFFKSFMFSMFLILNPLYIYSTFGFMTEIYYLFFFLLTLLLFYRYEKNLNVKHLLLADFTCVLGFFVRQISVLFFAVSAIYFLVNKRYKEAVYQVLIFLCVMGYYALLFPKSEMMKSTGLLSPDIFDLQRAVSVFWAILIYVAVFLLGLVGSMVLQKDTLSRVKKVGALGTVIGVALILFLTFKPAEITHTSYLLGSNIQTSYGSAEFPYFGNIFGREGFYPDNLEGVKYHYTGYFDLFKYLELAGIFGAFVIVVWTVLNFKKLFHNFEFLFICVYMLSLMAIPKIYDRYLITLIPLFLILFARYIVNLNKIKVALLSVNLLFLLFLGYQYTSDFYLVNKYVWEKSNNLVLDGVVPGQIKAGHSWTKLYPNESKEWKYYIGYSGVEKQIGTDGFRLLDKHKIGFPFSLYIDPYVYLYERVK